MALVSPPLRFRAPIVGGPSVEDSGVASGRKVDELEGGVKEELIGVEQQFPQRHSCGFIDVEHNRGGSWHI